MIWMRAGQVSFAGSKFRLGVASPKMAGGSTFTSIKEAKASDYRAKHKERMKKFLIERAYTAKAQYMKLTSDNTAQPEFDPFRCTNTRPIINR